MTTFKTIIAQMQRLKNYQPKDEEFDYLITMEGQDGNCNGW